MRIFDSIQLRRQLRRRECISSRRGHKLMTRIGTNLDVAGLDDSPENRLRLADLIPLGRLCKVSDVANMACFLASNDASYITGAQVPVDGGRAI
jgi:NAD(P)-dependent dehydrogenase (short-subunit alcohol dehydrogenase family)